jgi:hypothetical protein
MTEQNKVISRSFDKILKTAKEVTVAYNSNYIPLNALYDLLQKSKMKKNKELGSFPKAYNKTIDMLYASSKRYCEANDLNNRLPLVVLGTYIECLKDGL